MLRRMDNNMMAQKVILLCVSSILFVLMSVETVNAKSDFPNWNTGEGGVKWLPNCDFPGHDIGNRPSAGDRCGRLCIDNPNCNHFSHYNGICYMKNIADIWTPRKPANGVVCGFLTCHSSYSPLSGHYCQIKG
jgi:hypothetical protein